MSALTTIPPAGVDPETQALQQRRDQILERARAVNIVDAVSQADANGLLVVVAEAVRAVEKRRKFFTDPLNQHVKAINELFRQIAQPLQMADSTLRTALLDYRKAEQKKLDDAKRKAEAEARKAQQEADRIAAMARQSQAAGEDRVAKWMAEQSQIALAESESRARTATALALTKPVAVLQADNGQSHVTKRWTFRVVDSDKVPREYMAVSQPLLAEAVRKGVREIPGVVIEQTETITVRGGL